MRERDLCSAGSMIRDARSAKFLDVDAARLDVGKRLRTLVESRRLRERKLAIAVLLRMK